MKWRLVFTKQAQKDARRLAAAGLRPKAEELLLLIGKDPLQTPPPLHRPGGDPAGSFSRRITLQHRLVYQVIEKEGVVKVLRLWTHYE